MIREILRLASMFNQKSVEVFEWDKTIITGSRLSRGPVWTSLTTRHPALAFTGWNLAHSVIKADFIQLSSFLLPGLGFLLQANEILDFAAGPNLRLHAGAVANLNDITSTSISGRLGQGLSLLFAQDRGYNFVSHLANHTSVRTLLPAPPARRPKIADFLFERGPGRDRIVLEAKGSFSQETNDPTAVKRVLKEALTKQADPWKRRIGATASYAVYSCFRDTACATPSALMFTDPPEEFEDDPIQIPQSDVRRHNYAAWLKAMGLNVVARRLINGDTYAPLPVSLPIFTTGHQRFAITTVTGRGVCLGIDIHALDAIGLAITQGEEEGLLYYSSPERRERGEDARNLPWSIFADGTFFGVPIDPKAQFEGTRIFAL